MYDLIIKNGRIIDSQNKIDKVADLAIDKGVIAGVGNFSTDAESSGSYSPKQAKKLTRVIDATGCIVSPGLIDTHPHIFPFTQIGTHIETLCFTSGVTTVIDPGCTGPGNYEGARWYLNMTKVKIKMLLSVTTLGLLYSPGYEENLDPVTFNHHKIEEMFNRYGDELHGLKLRLDKGRAEKAGCTNEPLMEALKLAEHLGTKLCVHCTNPPTTMDDILNVMRKGDMITHIYHNRGDTIIGKDGMVKEAAWAARKRGVYMDCSSGTIHHSFKTSVPALGQGFMPDTIGTDISNITAFTSPRVFNLLRILSRFLALGMSVNQVLECCTKNTAQFLGMENKVGCFTEGCVADVAVLKLLDKEMQYEDAEGDHIVGKQALKCMMTVADGEVVYRDDDI